MFKRDRLTTDRIFLGYPLDVLLNRQCDLHDYISFSEEFPYKEIDPENNTENLKSGIENIGGIALPADDKRSTGNIVIQGPPGSAKSTLGMQMAISCTHEINNYCSIYLSLEENVDLVKNKAENFGWKEKVKIVRHLHNPDNSSSPKILAKELHSIISQPTKNCRFHNKDGSCSEHKVCERANCLCKPVVIVPSLTPRSLSPAEPGSKEQLFWKRFKQVENLLAASKELNEKSIKEEKEAQKQNPTSKPKGEFPLIKMVCIDSLNVFGDEPLNRTQLFRIFDLFKRYNIIGVFIVEEENDLEDKGLRNIVEYLADDVISLTTSSDNGYYMRYLEIIKSRYIHQVYGKHPFKLYTPGDNIREKLSQYLENKPKEKTDEFIYEPFIQVLNIYPSLHYLTSVTKP